MQVTVPLPGLPWQRCLPFCPDCCHGLCPCHPVCSLLVGSVTVSLPFGLSVVFLRAANPTVTAGSMAAHHRAANPEPTENSVGRPGKSGLYSRADSVTAGCSMCAYALESWIWSTRAHTQQCLHTGRVPGVQPENLLGETERVLILVMTS